jgi:tape measure domain-containing protein
MTADIATLGIRIDARQVRDADSALDRLAQTGERTERSVNGVSSAMDRLQRLALQVGAALSAAEVIKQADAWANLQGQISLVADSEEQLAKTTDKLYQMAQRTRQGLKETVDLYTKIQRSTESLNKTDSDRLRVTQTINEALVTSHASTQASAAALLQLGQAFSAGQLRGQELNSVLEETPGLARAIAQGMGKTVGDLKSMAESGRLTSEAVFNSLLRVSGQVDAEFAKLPTTVGQASTQIQNSLLRTIGVFDQQNQLSHSLASGMTALSENMGLVVGVAATLGAVKLVNWLSDTNFAIQRNIAASAAQRAAIVASYEAEATQTAIAALNAQATLQEAQAHLNAAASEEAHAVANGQLIAAEAGATAATNAHTVAMERLTIAQRMYSGLASATSGLIAALGGPLGALVTVLGLAATAWTWYSQKEEEANRKAAADTGKSTAEIVGNLDKQIEKMRQRAELMKQAGANAPIVQQGGEAADRAAELLQRINTLKAQGNALDAGDQVLLITLQGEYDTLIGKAKTLAGVTAGVTAQTNADKIKDWLQKHTEYLDKAGKVAAAIAEAKKDLGDAFNSDIEKKIRASFDKADVDKARNAYQELIAGIKEKIAANEIEIAVGRDATEAQKEQIKFDQLTASGKLKLSVAQRASVQAALDDLAVKEKLAKAVQVQKDLTKADDESRLTQQEAAATLAVYAAHYGQLSDARDIDAIAVKNQFELQRKLLEAAYQGITYTQAQTDKLRADTAERTRNEQAILAQTKAFQYAEQLRQQNQQFTVDYTIDPKAKAAAQLAIDKALWQSRIALAAEGTEARQRLESEYTTWLQNQSIKPQLDAQIAMWDSVEQAARDAFTGMLSNGKGTFERLRDSLKNTLYALLYEMTLKKWIVRVEAQMVDSALASGTNGGGIGLGSLISAGKAIYSGFQSGITSSMGELVASMGGMFGSEAVSAFGAGMSLTTAQAATAAEAYAAAGNGAVAGGLTSGASASAYAIPIAGWVAAGMAASNALYKQGWDANNGSVNTLGKTVNGGMFIFNDLLKGVGLSNSAANIIAGMGPISKLFGRKNPQVESQGLRGTYSNGAVSGESYANILEKGGVFRSDKRYTNTAALDAATQSQITQAFQTISAASAGMAKTLGLGADALTSYSKAFDIKLTGDKTKDAQAVADFFTGVADDVAKMLVPSLDSFSRNGETASATLQRLTDEFEATTAAAQSLGKTAAEMFGSAGMGGAAARDRLVQLAGGANSLTSLAASFSQNYLTDAERLVPVSKALDAALSSLSLDKIPATTGEFKALVQSIDPTTEAGAKLLVSLLQVSDAFYQVHHAAEETAAAAAEKAKADAEAAAAALADSLDTAFGALQRAVDAQKKALQTAYAATMKQLDDAINGTKDSVSKLTDLSKTLHDAVKRAAGVDMGRVAGQAQIKAALATARAGGPLPTADSLKDAIEAVTADSRDKFSTFEDYQRDRLQTAIDLSNLADTTDDQLSVADKQLAVLEATKDATQAAYDAEIARLDSALETAQRQIDAVKGVDVSVQSVAVAIAALAAIIGGNGNAGIVGAYGNILGRAPDAAGMKYWQDQLAGGANVGDVTKAIANSAEAADKLEKLYETVLGRHGDAAGMAYWQGQMGNGVSMGQIEAAMRASDEARAKLASTSTSGSTSATTIAPVGTDPDVKMALLKIASYTQRAAVGIEDQNRETLENA